MTGGSWQSSFGLRLSGRKLGSGNVTTVKANPTRQVQQVMGFGAADDEVDTIVLQERTLAAGASENLDLYDGSTNAPPVIDITNDPVAIRVLRSFALWIKDGGDEAGVTVGAAASNPNTLWWGGTTPRQTVYPDANPLSGGSDAGVVVSTAARYVKVLNNGATSVTYIVAMGGSVQVSGSPMGLGLLFTYS